MSDLANAVKNGVVNLNYATVVLPPSVGGLSETGLFIPTEPKAFDVANIGQLRRCFVVQMQDGIWSAIPMYDGDDGSTYQAASQRDLIFQIGKDTGLKAVACIKTTGEDENDETVTASYLLYLTDSLDITDTTATSRGENASRKDWMTPSPASSNLRETKRRSGKVGPD